MTTLNLGVIDVPYANPPRAAGSPAKGGTQTTGDVAEWLETKYHVMEVFFELHKDDIAKALENSLAGSLETLLMGGPATSSPASEAMSEIEEKFKRFLADREMEALGIPGVPTAAAKKGINHRFKKTLTPGRPSFIDTGAYENSFKAFIDWAGAR